MTDEHTEAVSESRAMQAANLFDLRRIIGGVFTALGILLTIMGLFESDAEIDKAAGVNINLWGGLGMLVLGLLFVAWALLRPLGEQLQDLEDGDDDTVVASRPR